MSGRPSIRLGGAVVITVVFYGRGNSGQAINQLQRLKIGHMVGARVPGTGTAVWWMELLNGNIKYGIPQLGAKDRETDWFENSEIVPDIPLYNTPEDVAAGRDPQLEAAVRQLLLDLPPAGKK